MKARQKKNHVITAAIICFCAISGNMAQAQEINVRQSIGNQNLNKISGARLSGMFADAPKQTVKSDKEFGRRGCVTSIGNQTSGTSILDNPQDVNILGDVTNVCF